MQLFTIGYEGLSAVELIRILGAHHVQTLIDVRAVPYSRKPGFSKAPLAATCATHGIHYQHFAALGCPRDIRTDYQATGDWSDYTRRFLAYLDTQEESLQSLARLARRQTCALLCFEADVQFCHRLYVAQRLQVLQARPELGFDVTHLNKDSTPFAMAPAFRLPVLAGR